MTEPAIHGKRGKNATRPAKYIETEGKSILTTIIIKWVVQRKSREDAVTELAKKMLREVEDEQDKDEATDKDTVEEEDATKGEGDKNKKWFLFRFNWMQAAETAYSRHKPFVYLERGYQCFELDLRSTPFRLRNMMTNRYYHVKRRFKIKATPKSVIDTVSRTAVCTSVGVGAGVSDGAGVGAGGAGAGAGTTPSNWSKSDQKTALLTALAFASAIAESQWAPD